MATIDDYLNYKKQIENKPPTAIGSGSNPIFSPNGGQDIMEGPTNRPLGEGASGDVDSKGNVIGQSTRVGDYVYSQGRSYLVPNSVTDLRLKNMVVSGGSKMPNTTSVFNARGAATGAALGAAAGGFGGKLGSAVGAVSGAIVGNIFGSLTETKRAIEEWKKQAVDYDSAVEFFTDDNGKLKYRINYEKMGKGGELSSPEVIKMQNMDTNVALLDNGHLKVTVSPVFANTNYYKSIIKNISENYAGLTKDSDDLDEKLKEIRNYIDGAKKEYLANTIAYAAYKTTFPDASDTALIAGYNTAFAGNADPEDMDKYKVYTVNSDGEIKEQKASDFFDGFLALSMDDRNEAVKRLTEIATKGEPDERAVAYGELQALHAASNNKYKYKNDKYEGMMDAEWLVTFWNQFSLIDNVFLGEGRQEYLNQNEYAENIGVLTSAGAKVALTYAGLTAIGNLMAKVPGTAALYNASLAGEAGQASSILATASQSAAVSAKTIAAGVAFNTIRSAIFNAGVSGVRLASGDKLEDVATDFANDLVMDTVIGLALQYFDAVKFQATVTDTTKFVYKDAKTGDIKILNTDTKTGSIVDTGADVDIDGNTIGSYEQIGKMNFAKTSSGVDVGYVTSGDTTLYKYGDSIYVVGKNGATTVSSSDVTGSTPPSAMKTGIVMERGTEISDSALSAAVAEAGLAPGTEILQLPSKDAFSAVAAGKFAKVEGSKVGLKINKAIFNSNAALDYVNDRAQAKSGDRTAWQEGNEVFSNIKQVADGLRNDINSGKYYKPIIESKAARVEAFGNFKIKFGKMTKADNNYMKAKESIARARIAQESIAPEEGVDLVSEALAVNGKYLEGISQERADALDHYVATTKRYIKDYIISVKKSGLADAEQINHVTNSDISRKIGYIPMWGKKESYNSILNQYFLVDQEKRPIKTWYRGSDTVDVKDTMDFVISTDRLMSMFANNMALEYRNKVLAEQLDSAGMLVDNSIGTERQRVETLEKVKNLDDLKGKFKDMVKDARKLVNKEVPSPKQYKEMMEEAYSKGDIDGAIERYQKAVEKRDRVSGRDKTYMLEEKKKSLQNMIAQMEEDKARNYLPQKDAIKTISSLDYQERKRLANSVASRDDDYIVLYRVQGKKGDLPDKWRPNNRGAKGKFEATGGEEGLKGAVWLTADKEWAEGPQRASAGVASDWTNKKAPWQVVEGKKNLSWEDGTAKAREYIAEKSPIDLSIEYGSKDSLAAWLQEGKNEAYEGGDADEGVLKRWNSLPEEVRNEILKNDSFSRLWEHHSPAGTMMHLGVDDVYLPDLIDRIYADHLWEQGNGAGGAEVDDNNIVVIPVKKSDILWLNHETGAKNELNKSGQKIVKTRGIDGGLEKSEFILWKDEHPEIFDEGMNLMLERYNEQYKHPRYQKAARNADADIATTRAELERLEQGGDEDIADYEWEEEEEDIVRELSEAEQALYVQAYKVVSESSKYNELFGRTADVESYNEATLAPNLKKAISSGDRDAIESTIANAQLDIAPYVTRSSVLKSRLDGVADEWRKWASDNIKMPKGTSADKKSLAVDIVAGEINGTTLDGFEMGAAKKAASIGRTYPITYYRNGRPYTRYIVAKTEEERRVAQDIERILNDKQLIMKRGVVANVAKSFANGFRLLTTAFDPSRALPNFSRDTVRAEVTSGGVSFTAKGANNIFKSMIEAGGYNAKQAEQLTAAFNNVAERVGGDTYNKAYGSSSRADKDLWREYLNAGKESAPNKFVRFTYDLKTLGFNALHSPTKIFEAPGDFIEGYTRKRLAKSAFVNALKEAQLQGKDFKNQLNAAEKAADFAGHEYTANFGRKGQIVGQVAQYVPYFSTEFANIDGFKRAFINNPTAVARNYAVFLIGYLFILADTLSDEKSRRNYYRLTDYDRSNSIVISMDDGTLLTVPLDETLAGMLFPFRRILETMNNVDPVSFYEFIWGTLTEPLPVDMSGFSEGDYFNFRRGVEKLASSVSPTWATGLFEMSTGYDLYYGSSNKVSDEDLKERGIYAPEPGDYTTIGKNSATLRKISNATGIPQWQLQAMLSNYGGNVGQYVIGTIDKLSGATEEEQGGKNFFDAIFKSFVATEYDNAASQFYNVVNDLKKDKNKLLQKLSDIKEQEKTASGDALYELQAQRQKAKDDFAVKVGDAVGKYLNAYQITGGLSKSQAMQIYYLFRFDDDDGVTDTGSVGEYFSGLAENAAGSEAAKNGASVLDKYFDQSAKPYYDESTEEWRIAPTYGESAYYSTIYGRGTKYEVDLRNILEKKGDSFKNVRSQYKDAREAARKAKDWGKYDEIAYEYDKKLIERIAPYITRNGVSDVLTNSTALDYLEDWIMVPSEWQTNKKGRYVSLAHNASKEKAFARPYLKYLFGLDTGAYANYDIEKPKMTIGGQ